MTVMDAPAQLPARQSEQRPMNLRAPVGNAMTLKRLLENAKQQISDVLPTHLTPDRIMRVALVAVNKTPKLLDCTMESVLQSIIQAASLGLDPGGALGTAYLVPYGNQCTFIPSYRGLIELARRSGEIASISAHVVYKGDKLEYREGTDPVLNHEPDIFAEQKDQDIIGAYMVAFLKDGGKHVEFMNRQQIDRIRSMSRAGRSGPWVDHFPEMCRKTVVRRGSKYLPISSEKWAQALEVDNEDSLLDGGPSTSVGQSMSRTDALLSKVTGRPVSEGQTLEPTAEAVATAAEELRNHDFAVEPQAPEEPEPPVRQVRMPSDFTSPERLHDALNEAAMSLGVSEEDLGEWKKKNIPLKPEKLVPKDRAGVFRKFVEEYSGVIAE